MYRVSHLSSFSVTWDYVQASPVAPHLITFSGSGGSSGYADPYCRNSGPAQCTRDSPEPPADADDGSGGLVWRQLLRSGALTGDPGLPHDPAGQVHIPQTWG